MKLRQEPSEMWRWMALLMVLINVSFSYLSGILLPGGSILQVSQQYNSLFTPSEYAFAIWGVIYVSFMIYAIYQLLPSQRDEVLFDRLAKPLILCNVFGMLWMVSFRQNIIWLSMIFMIGMLVTAMTMHLRVRDIVLRDNYSNWISVPFSLLAGWLAVATMANASVLFIYLGFAGSTSTQILWTAAMILAAGMLGIFVCFRCRDFIYPAVISWGCVAIFIAQLTNYPYLGVVALVGAVIPLIWIVTTISKRISYRHRVWANKLSF